MVYFRRLLPEYRLRTDCTSADKSVVAMALNNSNLPAPASPPMTAPLIAATATSIIQDTIRLIENSRQVQDQLVKTTGPDSATFATVLLPLAHAKNTMATESARLIFYKSVSADEDLRDASRKAQTLLDDFAVETAVNEGLFRLIEAVFRQSSSEILDLEWSHYLQKRFHEHARNGLGLPAGSQCDRFREVKTRISELTSEFRRNLAEDEDGIWLTVSELEGVPIETLARLEKQQKGQSGSEADPTMLFVTFGFPVFIPVLRYANRAETRKRVYIANENKCEKNVDIFREVVILRDEAARLLGYPSHAALRTQDKMTKTPETVEQFLADLQAKLTAGGQREVQKLKALKTAHMEDRGEVPDGCYFLWDHAYYNRLMLEKEYSVDHQTIKDFFPLQTTISGMLEIFQAIFGLVSTEIVGEARNTLSPSGRGADTVWHEDMQIFSVWNSEDEGGDFAGYLYTDLYPRGGKTGGVSNFNLVPVRNLVSGGSFATINYTYHTELFSRVSSAMTEHASSQPRRSCAILPDLLTKLPASCGMMRSSFSSTSWATPSTTSCHKPPLLAFMEPRRLSISAKHPARCWRTGAGHPER